jgi:ABC-type Fe3+ transport system substrate-binding protein
MAESPQGSRLTWLGQLVVLLFIAGCGFGAWTLFVKKPLTGDKPGEAPQSPQSIFSSSSGAPVEIGIAYGTEKQRWMEWAVQQFAQTAEGKRIKVTLIPKGSLEAAQAILAGDEKIDVWSPASALYEDVFVQEWQLKQGKAPFLRKEALALSPMVFVMWAERYAAFTSKYQELSFDTIGKAVKEPGGWDGIAQKPEWGLFKFGHAHPNQSNSGLMTLVLMAFDFHKKNRGLAMKDILKPEFQTWMNGIETATTGMSNSTGNMMRDMVLRGPSSYDALCVYESVVIDYLKNAEGRWGELRVVYPRQNMWNDNPYYILDAPWSSADQRKAAGTFLDFLLSETVQRESLKHGFRPGNPAVPIKFPESPFVQYQRFGLQIDLTSVGEAPSADVINNLLASWQRSQGNR